MAKRMKKGSAEAKEWGRRMRLLRKHGGSSKINKGVSVKSGKVRKMSKRTFSHRHKPVIHAVPTLLVAGAIADPLFTGAANITGSPYDALKNKDVTGAIDGLTSNVLALWKQEAVMLVGAWVTKKLGRKFNVGTKEVKLL